MRQTRWTAIVTTFVAVLLAACGGDGESSSHPESADGASSGVGDEGSGGDPASGAAASGSAEAEVLDAYRAAKEAMRAAFDPPDPEDPDLLARWDGEALGRAQDMMRQLQTGGISWAGSVEMDPTVVVVSGETAVVRDCVSDSVQVVDTASGQPVGPETSSVVHVESDLEREDGTWKVVHEEELSESCTPT
ncbi:MAG: hypothetical protein ACRD2C_27790 [Acidimicrobiales bacterium]